MKFPETDTMDPFWLFLLTLQSLLIKLLLKPMTSVQTYDALWPLQNAYINPLKTIRPICLLYSNLGQMQGKTTAIPNLHSPKKSTAEREKNIARTVSGLANCAACNRLENMVINNDQSDWQQFGPQAGTHVACVTRALLHRTECQRKAHQSL